jgi:hypothetical protein
MEGQVEDDERLRHGHEEDVEELANCLLPLKTHGVAADALRGPQRQPIRVYAVAVEDEAEQPGASPSCHLHRSVFGVGRWRNFYRSCYADNS